MITPIRWAALAAAAVMAAGCGDSSGPHQSFLTGSALARHIDSVVVAARLTPADSLWAAYLEGAESVPAYGGSLTSIAVTTRSGQQTWHGFVLAGLSQPPDTAYFLWAYSDDAFTQLLTALLVINPVGPSGASLYLITNDTLIVAGGGVMGASVASAGDACSFTSGLHNYPNPPAAGTCSLGTFQVRLDASFSGDSLALGPQAVNGVVLK